MLLELVPYTNAGNSTFIDDLATAINQLLQTTAIPGNIPTAPYIINGFQTFQQTDGLYTGGSIMYQGEIYTTAQPFSSSVCINPNSEDYLCVVKRTGTPRVASDGTTYYPYLTHQCFMSATETPSIGTYTGMYLPGQAAVDAFRITAQFTGKLRVNNLQVNPGIIPYAAMNSTFTQNLLQDGLGSLFYFSTITGSTETPSSAGRNLFGTGSISAGTITMPVSDLGAQMNPATIMVVPMGSVMPSSIIIQQSDSAFSQLVIQAPSSSSATSISVRVFAIRNTISF